MLNYVRRRAVEALGIPHRVVLATTESAGVQAGEFPCKLIIKYLFVEVVLTKERRSPVGLYPGLTPLHDYLIVPGRLCLVAPG